MATIGVLVDPVTGIPADGVPVLAAMGVLVPRGAVVLVLAGKVLTAAGVPVVPVTGTPAAGVPDVLPAGAQAARARDKITKKVPIRVNRFNFCCFIIKPPIVNLPIWEA